MVAVAAVVTTYVDKWDFSYGRNDFLSTTGCVDIQHFYTACVEGIFSSGCPQQKFSASTGDCGQIFRRGCPPRAIRDFRLYGSETRVKTARQVASFRSAYEIRTSCLVCVLLLTRSNSIGVTFLSLNKKVTKEVSLRERLDFAPLARILP